MEDIVHSNSRAKRGRDEEEKDRTISKTDSFDHHEDSLKFQPVLASFSSAYERSEEARQCD